VELDVGEPGVIVDGRVNVVVADPCLGLHPTAQTVRAIAGDAVVAGAQEASVPGYVHVQEVAGAPLGCIVWHAAFSSYTSPSVHMSPGVRDTTGTTFSATSDGDLVIGAGTGCTLRRVYRWESVVAFLRTEMVADNCPPRAHVVPGDWSR
jgi:hypothetical protein